MATTYYDVVSVGTQWAMKVDGHDQAWCYPTQDQALNVAIDAARSLWERNGIRSAVRLQQPDGQWQRKRTFGGVTPFPEGHRTAPTFPKT
jgi:hypothetical protein